MKKRYYAISDDPSFQSRLIVDKEGLISHFDMAIQEDDWLNEPWCVKVIEMEEDKFLNLPEFAGW